MQPMSRCMYARMYVCMCGAFFLWFGYLSRSPSLSTSSSFYVFFLSFFFLSFSLLCILMTCGLHSVCPSGSVSITEMFASPQDADTFIYFYLHENRWVIGSFFPLLNRIINPPGVSKWNSIATRVPNLSFSYFFKRFCIDTRYRCTAMDNDGMMKYCGIFFIL